MVVATIVLVLSGISLAYYQHVELQKRTITCGRNQSQIGGALYAYSINEETGWPDPRGSRWKMPVGPITTTVDAAKYTAGAFELLAATQSIPHALFTCPSATFGGPNKMLKASISDPSVRWGWDPARGVAVSYAFDWASPTDPSSARVILSDREVTTHRDSMMVTFGDAHVKKVKLVEVKRGAGVLVTESLIVSPTKLGTAVHPDDDIFSTEGDAGEPLTPGKGDPQRAWVK